MNILVDNLSPIYGRTANYTCLIPDTVDLDDFSYKIENDISRSTQLSGYFDEQFVIESPTQLSLEILLSNDYEFPENLKEEYQQLFDELGIEDIRGKCLGKCGFCSSHNSPFCSLCSKKYKNITNTKLEQLQIDMIKNINKSQKRNRKNIETFLKNPLPDFTFNYRTEKNEHMVTFRCISII